MYSMYKLNKRWKLLVQAGDDFFFFFTRLVLKPIKSDPLGLNDHLSMIKTL